jgi:broad specificity phosphatase PhoE
MEAQSSIACSMQCVGSQDLPRGQRGATIRWVADVYVIRHGETEWSVTGQHTGRTDVPLTAHGEQQARKAGAVLAELRGTTVPPRLVLASPRSRAGRTAQLAGLIVDDVTEDLAEWDYGDYEGLTTEQIRESVPDWSVWTHEIPGGETAKEVGDRADAVLDRARQALDRGDVVLIGHGHFSRVLVVRWLGLDPAAGIRIGLDPAGISVLGEDRGQAQIRRLNVPPLGEI